MRFHYFSPPSHLRCIMDKKIFASIKNVFQAIKFRAEQLINVLKLGNFAALIRVQLSRHNSSNVHTEFNLTRCCVTCCRSRSALLLLLLLRCWHIVKTFKIPHKSRLKMLEISFFSSCFSSLSFSTSMENNLKLVLVLLKVVRYFHGFPASLLIANLIL